jgi:hypothetical protein
MRPRGVVVRALLGAGALLAAVTLDACAKGRLDESTTDVPISGRSPRVDPDPVLDGAVDEYGDPIKPTPDIPDALLDGGAPRDAGGPARDVAMTVDAGACGSAGRPCCAGSTCSNNLRCAGSVCAEASPCGAWNQPCCGVSACGPGLTCGGAHCGATASCGASGQPCCAGTTPCLARQLCASATCRPCGAAGQPCCTAVTPACNAGLRCAASFCTAG